MLISTTFYIATSYISVPSPLSPQDPPLSQIPLHARLERCEGFLLSWHIDAIFMLSQYTPAGCRDEYRDICCCCDAVSNPASCVAERACVEARRLSAEDLPHARASVCRQGLSRPARCAHDACRASTVAARRSVVSPPSPTDRGTSNKQTQKQHVASSLAPNISLPIFRRPLPNPHRHAFPHLSVRLRPRPLKERRKWLSSSRLRCGAPTR